MFRIQYPWKYQWKHKNLAILFLTTMASVYILTVPEISQIIRYSGGLGYLGAFLAGFFFSIMFTAPLATVTLMLLGNVHDPIAVTVIASFGTVIANFATYFFVRRSIDTLTAETLELKLLVERYNPLHFTKEGTLLNKIKTYMVPVFAGFILASPLPDEVVIGMLGAAHYDTKKMAVFSFVAHFIGILALVYLGRALF
jgi:uncharacterized membrane protein YdjX (TVP38/TMEM64 family)